jgi:uncharacterized protein YbaA (DUF1428 family)
MVRKYVGLPIAELVSDVPVDPVHARELADSIMGRGQLAPVIVREESREVIDGFHRIAAMKELGFKQVECVLTPCDDEGFWDFRIIQASLHKNVTFARAIDWIDKVFKLSPWTDRYKSAYSLFKSVRKGDAPKEVTEWAGAKAKVWGLSPGTIENWLKTKESLEPSLLEEVKKGEGTRPTDTYIEIASTIPNKPDLHRPIVEKAKKEDLSSKEVREIAKAVRRAEDEEEVQSILKHPVSRTEDQMVRDAKVEKLLSHPREVTPLEKYQEAKAKDVLYKLDLLGIINSTRAMTQEKLEALTPEQKADVYHTCEEAVTGIRRIMDMIKATTPKYLLKEG